MIDYERFLPRPPQPDRDAAMRKFIPQLMLAGIVALVGLVLQTSVQIARLQEQVLNVQVTLLPLPGLSKQVTLMQVNQADLMKRADAEDARWERLDNAKVKRWSR